jgi:2-iminobutanoate/2-iminopropanoate deaminase
MKEFFNPKGAPKVMGAYSPGVKIDLGKAEMTFVTGQIAIDNDGNPVAPDDIEKQTHFVFKAIENILTEAGASLDDIVKATFYVVDIRDYETVSAVRDQYLSRAKPASLLIEAGKLVKEGCGIEIEVVAFKEK